MEPINNYSHIYLLPFKLTEALCGAVPRQGVHHLSLFYAFHKLWEDEIIHHHKFHTNHKQGPAEEPFVGLLKLYLWSQCI